MTQSLPLERIFIQTLRDGALAAPGDRILIALSGGADSVALLHLFLAAAPHLGLTLAAAHLDHAIRMESNRDALFVRDLCERAGVPLLCERQDIPALAKKLRSGLEETGREARRRFLADCAARLNCDHIAFGHHRDDQAETVLHHLLRGSGISGLAAMRPSSGRLIRPLLAFSRAQLRDYLASRGENFREDESNSDPTFTRNRIRHAILPELALLNPRVDVALATLAHCADREEDYWEHEVDRLDREISQPYGTGWAIPVAALNDLHPALRYRLLRHYLNRLAADSAREIGSRHIEAVVDLISGTRPQRERNLPGVWAARRYDTLLLQRLRPASVQAWSIPISAPGKYHLPGNARLVISSANVISGESMTAVEFDGSTMSFPLTGRSVRPRDRIRIRSLAGHKRVKDLLQEARIPREERSFLPVVEVAGEILWIAGIRRCADYEPKADRSVLRISLQGG